MIPITQNRTHNLADYAQPRGTPRGYARLCGNGEVVRRVLRDPGNRI